MAAYEGVYWHLLFWLFAGLHWQAMADTRQCVKYHFPGENPSFVEKLQGKSAEKKAPEMVEHYRGDIWFGLIDANYIIQSSNTLSLALDAKAEYIYTPSFMLKLFSGNPWLKYRVLDFSEKQKLLQAIRKRIYGRRWFSKRTPIQEITRMLSDQFFSRLFPRSLQLSSSKSDRVYKKELIQLMEAADVAGSISRLVKGNNTESVFSWVESIKRNPFSTVMHVIAHSFNSSIGGIKSLSQQSLNRSCFALAHKSDHILPVTPLFPGGILGKIMQIMTRSYLKYFHVFLLPFKGIVSIVLAILCRLGVPRIVHQVFTRLARAKRRIGRAASGLWYKYVGLRGDPIGRNMLDDVLSRSGIVMITLLFQLHAVDVESVKGGGTVEGALPAGGGAWALSDGLFVGLKDFGQMFKQLMYTYVYFARKTLDHCSGKVTLPRSEVKKLDTFLNGARRSQQLPATRLYTWCQENPQYLKRLANNLSSIAYRFGKQVVKVLRMEFTAFSEYFANVMSIFYELTFSTLESELRSALSGNYGRPEYNRELRTLLARHEALSRPKAESAMPRSIFRKPWMKVAVRKLANGYFLAAGALAVLDLHKSGDLSPGRDDTLTVSFRAYTDLATASALIRSAVGIIFGHFLHSQALISTAKGQKLRMKVYDFINQCQDRTAPGHAEVCGETVTKSIDEVKFISKSLLALNAGVAADAEDLVLTRASANYRGLDITSVFADWRAWLLDRGRASTGKAANFVAYAEHVSSKEKVYGFIQLLRTFLERRLRFYRFEVETSGGLRLFDLNGRAALFKPRSRSVMKEFLRHLKPDPLDAPAAFVVHNLSEGQLLFAEAPALPLDGFLTYENERRELKAIQHDALAVKDLLVAHLTKHLGRLKAEMVAMLLLVLHRKISQFRDYSVPEFLRSLSPKMFFDGVLILSDYQRQSASTSLALERSLYRFPFSLSSLTAVTTGSLRRVAPQLILGDTSDALSIFSMSVLHSAYQMIQKTRTGRTKVLEHFQKTLLYVVDELDAGRLAGTFPECAFLLSSNEIVAFKTALKCALYRFQKLKSLNLQEGAEKGISSEQIIAYLDAVVDYLDRVRSRTPWRTFFNLKAFRPSADVYRNRAAKYTYEELERHVDAYASESADPLTAIQKLIDSSRDLLISSGKGQGNMEIFTSVHAGLSKMAGMASQRLRAALSTVQGKIVRTLGSESIPRPLRLLNAISGPQFFGALEYAEFKVFPDTQALPRDFIQTTDLSFFGRLLLYLEPVGLYLENATAMYNIVSEMRTMPLVTPEATELVEDITKKVRTMNAEDVRVAAGYVASHSDGEGPLMAKRALALMSLGKGNTSSHATDILSVLDPTFLGFILKVLDYPLIFRKIKALSEEEALKILRFRPRGSLDVAFPFRKTVLPVSERLVIEEGLGRLVKTGLLDRFAAMEGQHEGGGNGELTCLRFYEELRLQKKADSKGALRLASYKEQRGHTAAAACALFFSLKEMQKSGRTETTVEDLLQQQYQNGSSITSILKRIGSTRTKYLTRVKLMGEVNQVLSIVYKIATKGGLDASLNGYSMQTGHLSFTSRETAGVTDQPLYDLFSQVIDFLEKNQPAVPDFFKIHLSSYYAEEWIRFLETDRLTTYSQNVEEGSLERISPETFRHVSSVYTYYDLIDYHISLRQRSVVPVEMILKNASRSLMEQPNGGLAAYGLAMANLDLGEEIKKAKLSCYDQALTDYTDYIQRDRQSQEMWKIDCVHDRLSRGGSLSYSVASLTPEEASLLIVTTDNELRKEVEARYTALLQANTDIELFKRRAWSFITLPHVSLRSASRLSASVYLAKILVGGLRRQLPWSAIVDNVAETRENKVLSRQPYERGPQVYSSTERPYLYNPFQIILDLLTFFTTNKIQRLRLPRLLLRKRAQILARLPLLRRRSFYRELVYAEELARNEQALSES